MTQPSALPGESADRDRYRRERAARLAREVEFLRPERDRLERLLGVALTIAVAGSDSDPLALLEAIAAVTGDQLDRPACVVERERAELRSIDALVRLLRDSDPARIGRMAA